MLLRWYGRGVRVGDSLGYIPVRWGPDVLMGDAPPRFFSEAVGRRDDVGLSGRLPVLTSPRPVQEDQIQASHGRTVARDCWHCGMSEACQLQQLALCHVSDDLCSNACASQSMGSAQVCTGSGKVPADIPFSQKGQGRTHTYTLWRGPQDAPILLLLGPGPGLRCCRRGAVPGRQLLRCDALAEVWQRGRRLQQLLLGGRAMRRKAQRGALAARGRALRRTVCVLLEGPQRISQQLLGAQARCVTP